MKHATRLAVLPSPRKHTLAHKPSQQSQQPQQQQQQQQVAVTAAAAAAATASNVVLQPQGDAESEFTQNPLVVEELWQPTSDLLAQDFAGVHELLVACIQTEMSSNQFDGLLHEQRVFTALRKYFRKQQIKAEQQCRMLIALLSTYLSQLHAKPIVHCGPKDLVASTLEYLIKDERMASPTVLYPIVNAIDSLSIEQRECLDALVLLWKWLVSTNETAQGSSDLAAHFATHYHPMLFQIDHLSVEDRKNTDALGACFVRTLVEHSDHIFRRDLGLAYEEPTLSFDSDTDDADEDAEDPSGVDELIPNQSTSCVRKRRKGTNQPVDDLAGAHQPETEPEDEHAYRSAFIAAAAGTIAAALCVFCY
ncbi:TPA: hypothetical protein N0F65_008839 [Lagenidium giganteum]|uniref:Uncharacterized protein n=1 Tax=Lagenidium giganteum TaxID=4803 RepID=A0AAV2YUB7_9STRA|nr:TPA: hypothetical protein N0F65_008839 [Lagenidium giganteum]